MGRLKLLVLIIVGLAMQAWTGSSLAAAPRIALVIGNSAYEETPLANPANDARLIAATLRDLGFEVMERIDADQKTMKYAIVEFGERLDSAGKDAVGLFFYAGHGLQVNGENYLVPLNANIAKESHVAIEAVSAGWVLGEMEFARNRLNLVILDACRNNPLTRSFRSPTRGLARMDAPRGSLIAYSTGPGDVALDGAGANSPCSAALARAMREPGIPAEKAFKRVRDMVMAETKDQQVPWEESSLTGEDFFFVPAAPAAATPTASMPVEATLGATPQYDPTSPLRGRSFDGKWIVKLTAGGCPVGKISGTIVLLNSKLSGTITAGTRGVYKVSGSILPSGVLKNVTLEGRYFVRIKGSISGDKGGGTWEESTGECDGTVSFARTDSE